jgi:hypothetical protein
MLASVTRLRLRSVWVLLPFLIRAIQTQKQALSAPGCHGARTRKTAGLTFWTLSVWESEQSLRAFLAASPHREAMPKLYYWCDEAALARWPVESNQLPAWGEATAALRQFGRLSRVKKPSAAQSAGHINAT